MPSNCSKAETKIKTEMKKLEIRYFTHVDKITVLKTQIIPKLNDFFISLSNSYPICTQQLNAICFKVIWDQKPDKISRKQFCNLEGGLNMIGINSFINYLNASWIHNLSIKVTAQILLVT